MLTEAALEFHAPAHPDCSVPPSFSSCAIMRLLQHVSRFWPVVDQLALVSGLASGTLAPADRAGGIHPARCTRRWPGGQGGAGPYVRGRARAEIVAEFDLPADEDRCASGWSSRPLAVDDEVVLLRRVVEVGAQARINGTPVVLARLRAAGDFLADIPASIPITPCCAAMPS